MKFDGLNFMHTEVTHTYIHSHSYDNLYRDRGGIVGEGGKDRETQEPRAYIYHI